MENLNLDKMFKAYKEDDSPHPEDEKELEEAKKEAGVKSKKESREAMVNYAKITEDYDLKRNALESYKIKVDLDDILEEKDPKTPEQIEKALEECRQLHAELMLFLQGTGVPAHQSEALTLKIGSDKKMAKLLSADIQLYEGKLYGKMGQQSVHKKFLEGVKHDLKSGYYDDVDKELVDAKIKQIEEQEKELSLFKLPEDTEISHVLRSELKNLKSTISDKPSDDKIESEDLLKRKLKISVYEKLLLEGEIDENIFIKDSIVENKEYEDEEYREYYQKIINEIKNLNSELVEGVDRKLVEEKLKKIEGQIREGAKHPEDLEDSEKTIISEKGDFQKIELPKDPELVSKLKNKLGEYRDRQASEKREITHYLAPTERFSMFLEKYKLAVLEKLLHDGMVDINDLSRELNEKDGKFDEDAYKSACNVIKDYCDTGGENVMLGTGLK